jgi:hypothetical protein
MKTTINLIVAVCSLVTALTELYKEYGNQKRLKAAGKN